MSRCIACALPVHPGVVLCAACRDEARRLRSPEMPSPEWCRAHEKAVPHRDASRCPKCNRTADDEFRKLSKFCDTVAPHRHFACDACYHIWMVLDPVPV